MDVCVVMYVRSACMCVRNVMYVYSVVYVCNVMHVCNVTPMCNVICNYVTKLICAMYLMYVLYCTYLM